MIELEKIKKWDYQHAFLMLFAGLATAFLHCLPILLIMATVSFLRVIAKKSILSSFPGYANLVTLFRLGLLILLSFFVFKLSAGFILLLGIIILILDGVDGYLARRFRESSDFGAYLDMEADTFFVCFFCTYYYLENLFGWWVLLPGFMRYLYVVFILIFKLQGRKEKSTRFAKTIAVILFSALLMPLILPRMIYFPAMLLASILVVYSFGISFWGIMGEEGEMGEKVE